MAVPEHLAAATTNLTPVRLRRDPPDGPTTLTTLTPTYRALASVVAFVLLAAACAGGESAVSTVPLVVPSSTSLPGSTPDPGTNTVSLLSGTLQIPAAGAFGDPGFHETFVLTGVVPESAGGLSGELVVKLFDVSRPNQTCDRDHPLSGCVTVDWSDFEDRPGVPAGGVFDNRLSVVSISGTVDYFLSERRGLAATPDDYSPT